jgi:hypothetical protein
LHRRPLFASSFRFGAVGAVGLLSFAACSTLEPRVGPIASQCVRIDGVDDGQDADGYGYGDDSGTYDSGAYGYGDAGGYEPSESGAADGGSLPTTCPTPTGSACDDCESINCCATRLGCYADPTCAAADMVLDQCLAGLADGGVSADGGASACRDAFAAQGRAAAQARLACERSCCPTACALPR